MLMEYKGNVAVKIDGIATSAASVVAMAGSIVVISPLEWYEISIAGFGKGGGSYITPHTTAITSAGRKFATRM